MLQHDAEDMNRDMGSLMRSLQHAILEKTTTYMSIMFMTIAVLYVGTVKVHICKHTANAMYIYIYTSSCTYIYSYLISKMSLRRFDWNDPSRLQKEERGRGSEEASKKAQEAMDAAKKRLIQKRKQELLASNIIKMSDH